MFASQAAWSQSPAEGNCTRARFVRAITKNNCTFYPTNTDKSRHYGPFVGAFDRHNPTLHPTFVDFHLAHNQFSDRACLPRHSVLAKAGAGVAGVRRTGLTCQSYWTASSLAHNPNHNLRNLIVMHTHNSARPRTAPACRASVLECPESFRGFYLRLLPGGILPILDSTIPASLPRRLHF